MNQFTRDQIVSLFLAKMNPRTIERHLGLTGQRQKIYETIEDGRRKGVIPRAGIWGRPKQVTLPAVARIAKREEQRK
jgi:hypothetical protein